MHRIIIAAIILGSAYGTYATYDAEAGECPRGETRVHIWARNAKGKPYEQSTNCKVIDEAKVIHFVRNAEGRIVRQGAR